jgi:Ca2+-binding RTX toxin-like protein
MPSPKAKPAKFSYDISPDTANPQDHYTSGNATHQLVLSGTGAAGDTVTVSYLDPVSHTTVTLPSTTVLANGTWSLTTTSLAEGSYRFSITENGALKTSATSPTWVIDAHTTDTIANIASFSNQNTVQLTGTAEIGDTVRITYTDPATHQTVTVGTTTTDSTGHWSLSTGVLPDNSYAFTATATDRAGNTATSTYSIIIDTTLPAVTNITSVATNQTYHTGDGIDLTVAFSEVLHVTGTPTLTLSSGGTATYTGSGDGTNTLTFHYTVAAGESTADLNVTALVLASGATIKDNAGNDVSLTVPASHTTGALDTNKDLVIDTTTPQGVTLTGNDTAGGYIVNELHGGTGDDTLTGGNASYGGEVVNYLFGEDGNDILTGGNADGGGGFFFFPSAAYNYLYGGTGEDALIGGNASNSAVVYNYLYGGTGDTLIAGTASSGGSVINNLFGDDGNNTLTGGSADDDGTLVYNRLYAGTGDDILTGGTSSNGADVVTEFHLDDLSVGDHVYGGGTDELETYGTSADDNLTVSASGWILNGSSPLDIIGIQEFHFDAGDGNDFIDLSQSGLKYVDIHDGAGNDIITGTSASNGAWARNNLFGEDGTDTLTGGNADGDGTQVENYLYGADGDIITGGSSSNGGYVQNYFTADGATNTLTGGSADGNGASANNSLNGGTGNDALIAGTGSNGGQASNYFNGGAGTDTFVFASGSGHSEIGDLTAGSGTDHDIIDLSAYGFHSLEDVVGSTTDFNDNNGTYCVIQLDTANNLTLWDVTSGVLTTDNFIFA